MGHGVDDHILALVFEHVKERLGVYHHMRLQPVVAQDAWRHGNAYTVVIAGRQLVFGVVAPIQVQQRLAIVDGERYAIQTDEVDFLTHRFEYASEDFLHIRRQFHRQSNYLDIKVLR